MSDYASGGPSTTAESERSRPTLEIDSSRQFPGWLAGEQLSIGFTTYQSGKLFLIGLQPNQRVSVFERTFNRCMGLYANADASTLYMSSLYQLWRFHQAFDAGQDHNGYDRLYVPRVAHTTGDVDAHDIAEDKDGQPVFVNTLFSCLATTSDTHSFKPLWKPPWISRLAAEDRCHLNGLAMQDGKPRYVTSVAESDVVDGWREHRGQGGLVYDLQQEETICRGLSMPHSPRLYKGKLWLLDSGSGYFGYVDQDSGKFERVTFCPGFLRGLAFTGNYAVVGTSMGRHNKAFQGLELDDNLATRKASGRCGIQVIDLKSGDIVHSLRINGIVEELYDVVVLPGVRRPMALGFRSDEIRRVISVEDADW